MRRIALVLFVVAVTVHASAASRHRAVGKPSTAVLPIANYIDVQISAKLVEDGIAPAAIAGDTEFLRRVTIDLTGRIPTPAEVDAFLADTRADKRARKIDDLLASDAFTDRWTMWFGDLVQNVQFSTNIREYYLGKNAYYTWIHDAIASHEPYDAMVRDLMKGEGDSFQSGAANYVVRQIQRNGPPQDTYDNLAAHSAEKFLGIPLLCLSCHNGQGHLELVNTWLKDHQREDFWKMAAFFSNTTARGERYTDPENPNANIIKFNVATNSRLVYLLNTDDGNKTPRAPADGESPIVTPAFITTGETPRPGEPYRVAYGRMLTADRQFARNTVNQLWKEMFGRGLVEPLNAFDLAKLDTQPSHPALLEALTDAFIAGGYSLREILRTMALSSTYQLSATYGGTQPDESYFARRAPHRLEAEVLFDAVADATSLSGSFNVRGIGRISRAMQLPDPLDSLRTPASTFLNSFGRGNRDDILRSSDASISQALAMMNDPIVTSRVKRAVSGSTVQKLLSSTNDPATIADQLYLDTLSRHPTATEQQAAVDYLKGGAIGERTEDLQFVLLNSLEFLFN